MLVGIGRDARYRKQFDDAADAFLKLSLAVGVSAVMVIFVSRGWLWSADSRSPLYRWDLPYFPICILPLFFGAFPAMILMGIQGAIVALSPTARKFPWGVDAVREEAAIKARNRRPV
jgi:hypothetical protein